MALEPACWSWPVPAKTVTLLARHHEDGCRVDMPTQAARFSEALRLYDQGRCAICGLADNKIEDHDHETGFVRGWLCRSCNTAEGRNRYSGGIWARYRLRYPYLILGITERYTGGWGWQQGGSHAERYPADESRPGDAMRGAF